MSTDLFPLFFTDLDGSLLDHHSYSWAAAQPALEELERREVPVIPTTSKTAAELFELRTAIGLSSAFIVENGGAFYLPKSDPSTSASSRLDKVVERGDDYLVCSLARPRDYWLKLLEEFRVEYPDCFEGFATMSRERLMELTSLDTKSADMALLREYGEPLHWLGSDQEKYAFTDKLKARGARVLQGGRFLHIGDQVDKGMALERLAAYYKEIEPHKNIVTVALGDGENDIDMLEVADFAVVIRSPVHEPPSLTREDGVIITKEYGPAGWNEAVLGLLEQIFTD